MALIVIVVPQQLCGLGNIVQRDKEHSRVVRVLLCNEGLNIGVVQRMIYS